MKWDFTSLVGGTALCHSHKVAPKCTVIFWWFSSWLISWVSALGVQTKECAWVSKHGLASSCFFQSSLISFWVHENSSEIPEILFLIFSAILSIHIFCVIRGISFGSWGTALNTTNYLLFLNGNPFLLIVWKITADRSQKKKYRTI